MFDRPLVTAMLVAVLGLLGPMLAQRVSGIASTWLWRLVAFVCLTAAWAIALLNEPLYTQARLHPQAYGLLTLAFLAGVVLFAARSRLLEATANLKARIMCLRVDTQIDAKDVGLDCQFTMSIYLRNDGTIPTTVTGFDFFATWNGVDYEGRQIQGLNEYHLKSFRPSDIGSQSAHTDEYEDLFDFPLPCEITTTGSQPGWLRFFIRRFPLEAGTNAGLKDDVVIRLVALDRKGDPHIVYKGPLPEGECGPILSKPIPPHQWARLT